MNFEEYLKVMRQREGITQKELAERAKISTSYLNLIETGKKKPNPTVIKRISKSLDGDDDTWLDLAGYRLPDFLDKNSRKDEADGSKSAIRIVGEVGSGESPYYGSKGPELDFDVEVIRVLDNTYRAFGYQQGDLLIVEERSPNPGELVVMKAGGGKLRLKVFEKSMFQERLLGSVSGLIRRFERRIDEVSVSSEPEIREAEDGDKMEETLQDIKKMLAKMLSEGAEESQE